MNEQPILALLEELSSAYRQRQADRYLACFAETAFVYGTCADEKCRGSAEIRAHLERDWSQSGSASFTLLEPLVTTCPPCAWVAADCRFDFRTPAGEGSMVGRTTFVLEESGGRWRIRHAHFSVPMTVPEGQSF